MNAIEELKNKKLKEENIKIVKETVVDNDVINYKKRLDTYGIRNKTKRKIVESLNKINNTKNKNSEKENINFLINTFKPFNVIKYKDLDGVCKDHNLIISSISNYDKAIPDSNLEEMDIFVDRLKEMDKKTIRSLHVCPNNKFSFDFENSYTHLFGNDGYYHNKSIIRHNEMFKIAAPNTHFDIPKTYNKIGRECHFLGKKPKFVYKPTLNKPNFELDPIVFVPIMFLEKIYCVIVTAWDEVADDSRILSKI